MKRFSIGNRRPQFAVVASLIVFIVLTAQGQEAAPAPKPLTLDGNELPGAAIPLQDDRQEHSVEMRVR